MFRIAVAAVALSVALAGGADAAVSKCRDAKGGFVACSAPGAKPAAASGAQSSAIPAKVGGVPHQTRAPTKCKTGKPCGAGCIPKDKVCRKG